ncbi:MAG: DNA alkylation repair protein [Candidatus Latescibacteria bacterium]|nr:DNA alkylation repair protein [Candidatus Latescibacterota bacterium]
MMPAKIPDSSTAAREALSFLREHADAENAASYQRYFKEPVDLYGVDYKELRKYQADLIASVRDTWGPADAVVFCKAMLDDPNMDARGLGFQVVAHFVTTADQDLLSDIRLWLEEYCGNWGLVDNLAPSVLAPLLDRYPDLIPEVVTWTDSTNLWLRRGVVVAFVPLVSQKKKYLATAYRIARLVMADEEDLMHKATGWLLREAGKQDPKRLEEFLLKHGPEIPRTSVRYAIEKFTKEDRQRIMKATR